MRRLGRVVGIALVAGLFLGSVAVAGPALVPRNVIGLFGGIRVYLDGQLIDTGGTEPFQIANGTVTVAPLRPILERLGYRLAWNAADNSIQISSPAGSGGGQTAAGGNAATPAAGSSPAGSGSASAPATGSGGQAWFEDLTVLRNVGSSSTIKYFRRAGRNINIAGRPFAHGVLVELAKGATAETVVDLRGNYREFTGFVGVEDETRNSSGAFSISIYADELEVVNLPRVRPSDYPAYVLSDLRGKKRLTVRVAWVDGGSGVGEGERVLAALADFRLK